MDAPQEIEKDVIRLLEPHVSPKTTASVRRPHACRVMRGRRPRRRRTRPHRGVGVGGRGGRGSVWCIPCCGGHRAVRCCSAIMRARAPQVSEVIGYVTPRAVDRMLNDKSVSKEMTASAEKLRYL
eukprot:5751308-Prymnesium_polylepis.1